MHPIMMKALTKAQKHVQSFLNPSQKEAEKLRKKLNKLDKEELIELLLAKSFPESGKIKVENVVYAILEDPDCAWLTWDMIAAIITSGLPGTKTTANSLQWYPSAAEEKGRTVVPRKRTSEIVKLMTSELV